MDMCAFVPPVPLGRFSFPFPAALLLLLNFRVPLRGQPAGLGGEDWGVGKAGVLWVLVTRGLGYRVAGASGAEGTFGFCECSVGHATNALQGSGVCTKGTSQGGGFSTRSCHTKM